jgi:hypothetical protein
MLGIMRAPAIAAARLSTSKGWELEEVLHGTIAVKVGSL